MKALLLGAVVVAASIAACGDDDVAGVGDDDAPQVDASTPRDASVPRDATADATRPPVDSGRDAAASEEDAAVCSVAGYPVSYVATTDESLATKAAVAAYEAAHQGTVVTLDEVTLAVTAVDGSPSLTLDANIADPCDRAVAALQTLLGEQAAVFRTPAGLVRKSCFYDDLTDSEIVRLEGGTYFGRPLVGGPTDVVAHVKRDGHLRFWAASYVPVLDRTAPTPCLSGDQAAAAVVGDSLEYGKFDACTPNGSGSIEVVTADTRTPLQQGVYVDAEGQLHFVRVVETLLEASRVGAEETNSTLFCCVDPSAVGCVGNLLVVDELTGAILTQIPRCHTC